MISNIQKENPSGQTTVPERLRAEQLLLVFGQTRLNQIISPLIGALVAFTVWPVGNHKMLGGWVAALSAISVWRYTLARSYHKTEVEARDVRLWERRFLVSLATASAGWGIGGWLIMPASSIAHQAFVYCFLIGMAGGTMAIYAAHGASVAIATLLMLGPSTIYFLTFGDVLHTAFALGAIVFGVAASRGVGLMNDAMRRSFELTDKLDWLSRSDQLSGLGNRRAFAEFGERALASSSRSARPCTLIMLDVDHFKSINDRWGHAGGDVVIQALGSILAGTVRMGDFPARIGGEEFAVILPDTTVEQGRILAYRILALVQDASPALGDKRIKVTVSIGVAGTGSKPSTLDNLLARADEALYAAKHGGRNRVVMAEAHSSLHMP